MKNFRLLIPFYFISIHSKLWVYSTKDSLDRELRYNRVRANLQQSILLIVILAVLFIIHLW